MGVTPSEWRLLAAAFLEVVVVGDVVREPVVVGEPVLAGVVIVVVVFKIFPCALACIHRELYIISASRKVLP